MLLTVDDDVVAFPDVATDEEVWPSRKNRRRNEVGNVKLGRFSGEAQPVDDAALS